MSLIRLIRHRVTLIVYDWSWSHFRIRDFWLWLISIWPVVVLMFWLHLFRCWFFSFLWSLIPLIIWWGLIRLIHHSKEFAFELGLFWLWMISIWADFSCFYYSGSDWIQLCVQRKNSGSTNKPTCFLFIFSFFLSLFLVISFSTMDSAKKKKKAHIQELEEEVKLLKNHSHPNIVVSV